jgi:putative flippase GtrA
MKSGHSNMSEKYNQLFRQLLKFGVVGAINTGIDFAVLNVLSALTGIRSGTGIIWLNSAAFTVAVANSYFMNKYWTFAARGAVRAGEASSFLLVSLVGLGINGGIVFWITTYINPLFGFGIALWENVAKLIATGVSLVWNFIGYKLLVFRQRINPGA